MSNVSEVKGDPLPIVDQHRRIIDLWVHLAIESGKKPDRSKIGGVFFAVTDEALPPDEDPQNVIELCEALTRWKGDPPLTNDERTALNVLAFKTMKAHDKGIAPIQLAQWMKRLNWLGYLLALISLVLAGFSWVVLILAFGTWFGHGSAQVGARMRDKEPLTMKRVHILPMVMHLGCLTGLIVFSVWRMVAS